MAMRKFLPAHSSTGAAVLVREPSAAADGHAVPAPSSRAAVEREGSPRASPRGLASAAGAGLDGAFTAALVAGFGSACAAGFGSAGPRASAWRGGAASGVAARSAAPTPRAVPAGEGASATPAEAPAAREAATGTATGEASAPGEAGTGASEADAGALPAATAGRRVVRPNHRAAAPTHTSAAITSAHRPALPLPTGRGSREAQAGSGRSSSASAAPAARPARCRAQPPAVPAQRAGPPPQVQVQVQVQAAPRWDRNRWSVGRAAPRPGRPARCRPARWAAPGRRARRSHEPAQSRSCGRTWLRPGSPPRIRGKTRSSLLLSRKSRAARARPAARRHHTAALRPTSVRARRKVAPRNIPHEQHFFTSKPSFPGRQPHNGSWKRRLVELFDG